jgi:hypothetical protein
MRLWASLSGNICDTILMKKMRPYLLLRPVGIDVSMLRARSDVRQFLSFVFRECSLYSCDASFTRSICLACSYHGFGDIEVSF